MLLAFGVLSAVPVSPGDDKIPGFPWLLFCRFGVGFGAGGTAQSYVHKVHVPLLFLSEINKSIHSSSEQYTYY